MSLLESVAAVDYHATLPRFAGLPLSSSSSPAFFFLVSGAVLCVALPGVGWLLSRGPLAEAELGVGA